MGKPLVFSSKAAAAAAAARHSSGGLEGGFDKHPRVRGRGKHPTPHPRKPFALGHKHPNAKCSLAFYKPSRVKGGGGVDQLPP